MTNDLMNYEEMVRDAYRVIVRKILTRVSKNGLPGDHHFYIAFRPSAPGVDIPDFLRARYPDEMTIVIQHDFWGLKVDEDRFEINLNFDRRPTRLIIPFEALTGFLDPSVQFGVRFQADDASDGPVDGSFDKPASPSEGASAPQSDEHETADDDEGKVIALDSFRKE